MAGKKAATSAQPIEKPTIRVKPHGYQPSKAEREEPVKIEATPEELARRALRPMKVIEDPNA